MKKSDVAKLKLGVYRIYWKSGGSSVAAVGALYDGTRWVAPANWTAAENFVATTKHWRGVRRAQLIAL